MLDAYAAMAIDDPRLRRYTAAIAAGSAQGHPAVAFALAARAAHIIARDAIVGYASSVSATLASAAARAVPLGQRAVVHTLWRLRPTIEECAERALASRSVHDLHAEAFAAEIDAMRHRRLDGRLFAS
jgi:urease accessory protein